MVHVEGFDGEGMTQICRYTDSQRWCGGDRRNNWVWVKQRPGRCYAVLKGCLQWQLHRQFKIKLQNEGGAFVEYWLNLALTTIPENSGNLDSISQFVQVTNAPAAVTLQGCSMGKIVGSANMVRQIATPSKTGDRWNERWIVNSHLELATWNDV